MSREEQAKYYELARKERQLHMQMYPGWSARDNYAMSKKKKRKRLMQHQQRDVVDGGCGGALQMKVAGANLATPRLSDGRVMDAPIKCDGKSGCGALFIIVAVRAYLKVICISRIAQHQ